MDELEIARKIASGDLASPQHYENLWLFAIRITGTGASYREKHKEYVLRDASRYLNDDFLERCQGLPVIVEHPPTEVLDTDEYRERNVGSVFLPFIRGDEVWSVVRIYDEPAARLLQEEQYSTSPAVVFRNPDKGQTVDVGGGEHLLIEGKPALLDHIAICSAGVWDKGGPPTGIDVSTLGTSQNMADEKEKAEERPDATRDDAAHNDLMTKLDAIAASLDSAHKRLDAFEKKRDDKRRDDAEEEDKDDRKDAKRDDAKGRKDKDFGEWAKEEEDEPEHKSDSKKRDDRARDDKKRDDESEEERAKNLEKGAEKAEEKLEKEERGDKKRDDAKARDDKARDDKAEDDKRDDRKRDDARADAAERENAELRKRLARLEGAFTDLTRETPAEERDALATAQARADAVACMFGERVPAPIPGQTSLAYRRQLIGRFLKHSPQFKDARVDAADSATLGLIENQVYADAQTAARDVASGKAGILFPVVTHEHGREITRYQGDNMAFLAGCGFYGPGATGVFVRNPNAA